MSQDYTLVPLRPLTAHGCQLTTTGLLFAHNMTFDVWEAVGKTLLAMDTAIQFALGDWINFGQSRYGEKYGQALQVSDAKVSTLMDYAYVASHIETSVRTDLLTWSHHKAVAALPEHDQRYFLQCAIDDNLTVRELKRTIREETNGSEDKPPHLYHCPNCGYEWSDDEH